MSTPPILTRKNYASPSSFTPENLLREARRQKRLANAPVPSVCVLDPDGDIVRYIRGAGCARPSASWACYHTDLYEFGHEGISFGMVGCAVGASYAVLVAEELFAAGCKFLISVTSAGQIRAVKQPPYFIVIDRALRHEGASYHTICRLPITARPTPLLYGWHARFSHMLRSPWRSGLVGRPPRPSARHRRRLMRRRRRESLR